MQMGHQNILCRMFLIEQKEYLEYKSNTVIAAVANNWKSEKQKLIQLFESIK